MGIQRIQEMQETAQGWSKRLRLDSHHAIERFGIFVAAFLVVGLVVLTSTGVSAYQSGRASLASTELYTEEFTTSKTDLDGEVNGVYTNELGDKALVVMNFEDRAQISYNAADYQAFLLGSDADLNSETVSTSGVTASFHVFGSSGYVGMLLDADEPFDKQVLNLTMRANAELSFAEQAEQGEDADEMLTDSTFSKYDQWQVFFNPGASGAKEISALESSKFDPAKAFHEVVLDDQEEQARDDLDAKLVEMRTDLSRVKAYTNELETTKVDGLFLRPPNVPKSIAGDRVKGKSTGEKGGDEATLALDTDHVVPGGFDVSWRAGNVYDGYLDTLVPSGQSTTEYLAAKREEPSDEGNEVSNMRWVLSDGTDLAKDYQSSDVTMQPLMNVMNNLSQAYQDYAKNKNEYQSELMLELLGLDVQLRDVQSNSSVVQDEKTLVVHY